MSDHKYTGVMVPILTPLTPEMEVDVSSLRSLVGYLLDNGVHGIWASGTTGEFPAFDNHQRMVSIDTVVDEVAGRVPVIANVSHASTQLTVDFGKQVSESGVDAIAATPPYYYSQMPDEMLEHFTYIQNQVGLPLWVYNIPQMVKTPVPPATVVELAAEGVVQGIKDSSGTGELLAELNIRCAQSGVSLNRMLGTTLRVTSACGLGIDGVIPGLANLIPEIYVKAWEAGIDGDREQTRRYDAKLMIADRVGKLALAGSVPSTFAGLKTALKLIGVIEHDAVARPTRSLTKEEASPIPGILRELGLLN